MLVLVETKQQIRKEKEAQDVFRPLLGPGLKLILDMNDSTIALEFLLLSKPLAGRVR